MASGWIDKVLNEEDLIHLKPAVFDLLERFFDVHPQILDKKREAYLAVAIIIISKVEEDDEWLDPSDMERHSTNPNFEDYKNRLIRIERKMLHCVQWQFTAKNSISLA